MSEHPHSGDLHRAYTTLGLPAGTSRDVVARQYRRLVRRWHPDRFANDPERHAEATRRMQDINVAFEFVTAATADDDGGEWPRSAPAPAPVAREQYVGRRLTEEEVEAISKAIGEPGIVTFVMRSLGWMGAVAAALLLLGFGGRLGGRAPRPIEVVVAVVILCVAGVSVLRRLRTAS